MKKRKLLIILLILLIMLLALVFYFLRDDTASKDTLNNDFKSNYGTVYNQGRNVLKYQNEVFWADNISNSIIRYNTETNDSKVIASFKNYALNENMYIVNNNLIYSVDNTTYYMTLDTNNNAKFTDGKVVYINDELYIYILQQDSLQYLYITSYDNKNFRRTNSIFYNLAKGYNLKFLRESDGLLFFSSVNSDKSTSLFSVDLTNRKINMIIREKSYVTDTSRAEISDVLRFGDDIYYTVSSIFQTTESEELSDYHDLYIKPINGLFSEQVRREIEPYLFIDKDKVFYGRLDEETNQYVWEAMFEDDEKLDNWIERVNGDISKYYLLENSKLYFNDKELIDLGTSYSEYYLKHAEYCDDSIYFVISKDTSCAYFKVKLDGSELVKIYEKK